MLTFKLNGQPVLEAMLNALAQDIARVERRSRIDAGVGALIDESPDGISIAAKPSEVGAASIHPFKVIAALKAEIAKLKGEKPGSARYDPPSFKFVAEERIGEVMAQTFIPAPHHVVTHEEYFKEPVQSNDYRA